MFGSSVFNVLNGIFSWVSILLYLGCAAVSVAYVRLSSWLWLVAAAFAGIAAVGAVTQSAVLFLSRVQGTDYRVFGLVLASAGLLRVVIGLALVFGLGLTFADIGRRFGPR